jgi:hypothetical protein
MMDESQDYESPETAELPLSLAGSSGVKEGDTIRLRVISVGDSSLTVGAAAPQTTGGSDSMAKEFDDQTSQTES